VNEPIIWTEALKIHSYDVDFRQRASLEALCRYFLEAAWNHAESLGFGFSHLASDNKVWVLSRLFICIERFPHWGDSLILHTWPRKADRVFALRDFEMLDKTGARIVGGASAWLVLDANTRRPQRIEKLLSALSPIERKATERDPQKLPELSQTRPGGAKASAPHGNAFSPTLSSPELARSARYSDVDLNGHVNSARYIGWLMDSYPLDWHEAHVPRQFEVNYLGESRAGDTLSVLTVQTTQDTFRHSIINPGRQEVCRAQIEWTA
jgi:medium-chain acyl-[acyl-carrier-protein] hydrolase